MTYNVLMGTLDPTHSLTHSLTHFDTTIRQLVPTRFFFERPLGTGLTWIISRKIGSLKQEPKVSVAENSKYYSFGSH